MLYLLKKDQKEYSDIMNSYGRQLLGINIRAEFQLLQEKQKEAEQDH